jgi:hypothetical protein
LVEEEKRGNGECIGMGIDPERKDMAGKFSKGAYTYPKFEKTDMSGNLKWCKGERRRETLMAAQMAYSSDPRHLSR